MPNAAPDPSWRDLDDAVRLAPHADPDLRDTKGAHLFPDRDAADARLARDVDAINALQDRLWAERRRALLVVLQGMDTSGKDGTVRGVFNATGPLGVTVTPFGRPSEAEMAQDYLWRVHKAVPPRGAIGIFNRSHYEDVLVARVRKLAPLDDVEKRYAQINAFEKHLAENGVTILKFMLNISKDEQKERLQERLDDPKKRWKWNAGDLEDRKLWGAYMDAYAIALKRCSTAHAPWRVIPADHKWRRNALIAAIVRGVLEEMDPQYPDVPWKPEDFRIE
ncbi:MAG: polyphosphate kinase 2 family protein [Alphaproteobacteria bacterium]|nr:polyphosphate kinase 2 family protein [Alphaproteobacteria bacterium]